METEFRDQIVEAVDEAEGRTAPGARRVPLAGALVGLGAAIGYLVGRGERETDGSSLGEVMEGRSLEDVMEGTPLEDVEPSEIVEEMTEASEEVTEVTETTESETQQESGRGRRIGILALVAGAVAGLAFLRRRRSGEEEWEPIEEFEPASDVESGEDEGEEEEAEATTEEGADGSEEETEE